MQQPHQPAQLGALPHLSLLLPHILPHLLLCQEGMRHLQQQEEAPVELCQRRMLTINQPIGMPPATPFAPPDSAPAGGFPPKPDERGGDSTRAAQRSAAQQRSRSRSRTHLRHLPRRRKVYQRAVGGQRPLQVQDCQHGGVLQRIQWGGVDGIRGDLGLEGGGD